MTIEKIKGIKFKQVTLPASKSISNRLLILNFIENNRLKINNLSNADDTVLLKNSLQKIATNPKALTLNLKNAGTTYRFLTALLATQKGEFTLNCSERMKKRPIKPLVDTLKKMGAKIFYTEKNGFPPLKIIGSELTIPDEIEINASQSSQFVSAILLILPKFNKQTKIIIKNPSSISYVKMTVDLMSLLGYHIRFIDNRTVIFAPSKISKTYFDVPADWSAATFWYALVSAFDSSKLLLKNLKLNNLQGDEITSKIFEKLGVKSAQTTEGTIIENTNRHTDFFSFDLSQTPDIFPALTVALCLKNIPFELTGIRNLKIKESDRISAIIGNFKQLQITFETDWENFLRSYCKYGKIPSEISIKTFNDHRIAMAFSTLAKLTTIKIDNANCVEKSYPDFWKNFFYVIEN